MTVRVYGFKGCDTVRKALAWLDAHGVEHTFVDYRRDGIDPGVVDDWFARAGWEQVFNCSSTAYRALTDSEQAGLDARRVRKLMLEETNFIKRPVLDTGDALLFGFKSDAWARALGELAMRGR